MPREKVETMIGGEQRFLVDQKIYDGVQRLTQDNQNDAVQAPGVLRKSGSIAW